MSRIFRSLFPVLLFGGACFLCWLFVLQYGVFGSEIDWVSQHSVLPEYFRQHFYRTGEFFPDIAWNLGGGQNIYNFAYYGLYNPVYMLSYLLPFVPTDQYIMGSSIVCYGISAVLFYFWLPKEKLSPGVRMLTACMFLLAGPLLYHSYNQLMFVNYMPFLLLALLGVQRSMGQRQPARGGFAMMTAGMLGMILCSFYFSIGGMAATALYGVYLYLEKGGKGFIREAVNFCIPAIIAVMLAGVLLVPTAAILFQGGREGGTAGSGGNALIQFLPQRFLYSPYGMGLSVLALVSLLAGVFCAGQKARRFLSIALLAVFLMPVFGYLLNGGLYNKDKVFIPFLPLVCLLTAIYAEESLREKTFPRGFLPYALTAILVLYSEKAEGITIYKPWLIIDFCAVFLLWLICSMKHNRKKKIPLPLAVSCILLFCSGWAVNKEGSHMIPRQDYKEITSRDTKEAVKEILSADTSWYRLEQYGNGAENLANINRTQDIRQNITSIYSSFYNPSYQDFRKNTFELNDAFRNNMMQTPTNNPCFLRLMGVKYLLADHTPSGYRLLKKTDTFSIFQAENPAPIIYATDQVISEEEYKTLPFPQNQTALTERAVIPDKEIQSQSQAATHLSSLPPCTFTLPQRSDKDITIQKIPGGYQIEAKKQTKVKTKIPELSNPTALQSPQTLALQFDVENENPNKDMHIRLQGQTNRLSSATHEYANHNNRFTYMVTLNKNAKTATLKFSKGKYKIKNIKAHLGNLENPQTKTLYQSPLNPTAPAQTTQTPPDTTNPSGTIKTDTNSYLITSIPYDKNFTIWVDGQKSDLLKVNTAFIGTKLPPGTHHIKITYTAPGKKPGLLLTLSGTLMLCIYTFTTIKYKLSTTTKKLNG